MYIMYKIKKFLKKLLCRHEYEKIFGYEEYDKTTNVRYSLRTYRCIKCGKKIQVDGRKDPFDNTIHHLCK